MWFCGTMRQVIGSLMAIFGFVLSYRSTKNNAADGTEISERLTP